MKPYFVLIAAAFLLSSCETNQQDKEVIKAQVKADAEIAENNAKRHTTRVAGNVRDQVKKTAMKMREWWLTPLPEPVPTPVPPSYCYKVWQDIVCYRSPKDDAGTQMVGYQGDVALTPPPPLLQTEPLPVNRIKKQIEASTGAARVANAKPVFVTMPVQPVDDTEATTLDTTQVGSEPLPDPALSPQL
jgi:hypothetical protein